MGDILRVNPGAIVFLFFCTAILLVSITIVLMIRKENMKSIEEEQDNNWNCSHKDFIIASLLAVVSFIIFNAFVYMLFFNVSPVQRICVNGEVFILDNVNYRPDEKLFGSGYLPIDSSEPIVVLNNKQYKLVEVCNDIEDFYCRTAIDSKTGRNIYKHIADILDNNIIRPIEKPEDKCNCQDIRK